MVDKDFWVCWTLDYLFHDCPWAEHLAFKGGTSLSKCFGLIQRFSGDIDLILDWRLLGYEKDEPWTERSKTRQDKFNKAANTRTEEFLRETFLSQLQADFEKMLNEKFSLYIGEEDPQTVCFGYSKSFQEGSILPVIRLEIGALAAWTPAKQMEISSYAAQQYPQVFKPPTTPIHAVAPERTFWEKVTILHKEAFRTNGKFPARYSRHYYDLWCMDKSPVKTAACGDLALLDRVYGSRTGSIHRVRPTMSWQNRARCDCFRQRSASLFCGRIMSIWKNMIFSSRRLWNVWRGWRGRSMGCEESSRL